MREGRATKGCEEWHTTEAEATDAGTKIGRWRRHAIALVGWSACRSAIAAEVIALGVCAATRKRARQFRRKIVELHSTAAAAAAATATAVVAAAQNQAYALLAEAFYLQQQQLGHAALLPGHFGTNGSGGAPHGEWSEMHETPADAWVNEWLLDVAVADA